MAITSITNSAAEFPEYNKADQKAQAAVQAVNLLPQTGAKDSSDVKTMNGNSNSKDDNKGDAQSNAKRIKSIVDDTNNKIKGVRRRCEFSYHEDINRVSIKVMNAETNEVIKEIPPEETLDMIEKLWEVAGLLVDEKR